MLSKEDVLMMAEPHESYCGVYFLVEGDEIVYVGQARDIMFRLAHHAKSEKVFSKYTFIECDVEELNEIEAAYIVKFAPRYNVTLPINSKWTTLPLLRRRAGEQGINYTQVKKHIKRHGIQDTNGFYEIADFQPLFG